MQVLLFLHRLYFFVILNIRNKKTYKMKKIIFLFIISSLISIKGIGLTLSPETEVSILTCAPGNELYSLFGHTAIRINDPRHQIDRVYKKATNPISTPHITHKPPTPTTNPHTKTTPSTNNPLSTSLLPIFI